MVAPSHLFVCLAVVVFSSLFRLDAFQFVCLYANLNSNTVSFSDTRSRLFLVLDNSCLTVHLIEMAKW